MDSAASFSVRVLSSTSLDQSLAAIPHQLLEHDPNDERTTFFVSKDSVKGTKLLRITRGKFEKQNLENLDLLAGIHIQGPGYVFLESLHPTQEIYFARNVMNQWSQKRLLPRSKDSKERVLVLLDFDSSLFIDDEIIEFKIGSLESTVRQPSSVRSAEMDRIIQVGLESEENEDPQVLVQQSHPQESLRRGSTDLVPLTPAVPETIHEEPRVHETPSVKSRFMNPESATVTLPRAPFREDTFGDLDDNGNLTAGRRKFIASVSHNGLMFGGHDHGKPGETAGSQLSVVDDADLSTSGGEEEVAQSSRFLKSGLESIESTADEEIPEVSTRKITPVTNMMQPASIIVLSEGSDDGSGIEDTRRQFGEAPIITSFTSVRSMSVSKEATPGQVEEGDNGGKNLDATMKLMKEDVPEGFLYEEHKKDVTPRQTYGKNGRASRAKPKGERINIDDEIKVTISVQEKGQGRSAKATGKSSVNAGEKNRLEFPSGRMHADEGKGTTPEVSEKIEPQVRTQGRRGRKTVESQPDSTAATVITAKVEQKSKRPTRRNDQSDAEETRTEPVLVTKSTRSKGGVRELSGAHGAPSSTTPALESSSATKQIRSMRKRRRTPENEEDQEPRGKETESHAESTIEAVGEPKSKRVKATPLKKTDPMTPASKSRKENVTPILNHSIEVSGDTQYTFPDATQTQTMDHAEVKTPRTGKEKATSSAKKTSTALLTRKRKEPIERPQSEDEGVDQQKLRTRDRYGGDGPKIVFSNSGLDGKKDIEKFLRANGGKKMQNVSASGVSFVVVGPGELKRTPKLIIGVALGKWVVEDQWLIDSKTAGYFLDPDPYIPHDSTHEKAWSFSLRTAITRGRNGENNILQGYTVYITSSLLTQLKTSKQEESLIEMLKTTGTGSIIKRSPKSKKEDDENGDRTLILGTEKGDSDAAGLEKLGWSVHGTGIIAVSVLRGRLETGEEEFRIVSEKEGSQNVASQKFGRGRRASRGV